MNVRQARVDWRSRSFLGDRIAWTLTIAAAAALAFGAHAVLHGRVPVAEAVPAAPAARGVAPVGGRGERLAVLAYDRVGAKPSDRQIEAGRLEEHLEALREAGFQPVTLRQVRDAYRGTAPLPRHAVLLTFDGGHLSTYDGVDPLLRRLRWPAVMFLDPSLPERRDPTYLYWDRLQRMVDSGLWEIGTSGAWPASAATISKHLCGREVLAVAPRTGAAAAPGEGAAPLVFETTLFGINGPSADTMHLGRFRVSAAWSGRALVERLELALGAPDAVEAGGGAPVPPARWTSALGRIEHTAGEIVLSGAPRAETWLAGSEWAGDFVFEAEVRPERGPFWIVQQAPGSREQWRWGGSDRALHLQRIRPGARVEVVSRARIATAPGSWHALRVVKRGGGVWVGWDGAQLPDMPRLVPGFPRGQLGVSTGSVGEPGRVSIRKARFAAIPYEVRPVSGAPGEPEVQSLLEDASFVAALSPPGLVQRGSKYQREAVDGQLLAMVAARGAWDLVPTVKPSRDPSGADPSLAVHVADVAQVAGWAGVRLTSTELSPSARQAWRDSVLAWQRVFEARGLRFVHDVAEDTQEHVR